MRSGSPAAWASIVEMTRLNCILRLRCNRLGATATYTNVDAPSHSLPGVHPLQRSERCRLPRRGTAAASATSRTPRSRSLRSYRRSCSSASRPGYASVVNSIAPRAARPDRAPDRESAALLDERAALALAQGDLSEVRDCWERRLTAHPRPVRGQAYARALLELGEVDEAAAIAEELLAEHGELATVRALAAEIALQQGDLATAHDYLVSTTRRGRLARGAAAGHGAYRAAGR